MYASDMADWLASRADANWLQVMFSDPFRPYSPACSMLQSYEHIPTCCMYAGVIFADGNNFTAAS
jgi:hypothetical protein